MKLLESLKRYTTVVADAIRRLDGRCDQQRYRPHVDQHHLVFGLIGDVDDLLGEQPDVQGV